MDEVESNLLKSKPPPNEPICLMKTVIKFLSTFGSLSLLDIRSCWINFQMFFRFSSSIFTSLEISHKAEYASGYFAAGLYNHQYRLHIN